VKEIDGKDEKPLAGGFGFVQKLEDCPAARVITAGRFTVPTAAADEVRLNATH